MVKLVTVAAITGTWLIAYELWKRYRQGESHGLVTDPAARNRSYITPLEWHALDEVANGKPRRFLNVNNFGLEELEVRYLSVAVVRPQQAASIRSHVALANAFRRRGRPLRLIIR